MSTTCTLQVVNRQLANVLGLDQALVLQQIQYWVSKCGREIESSKGLWIYNSLEKWHEQFSYWSLSKLRRVISDLEAKELIISRKVNAKKWNHTKWYTVNFAKLKSLVGEVKQSVKKAFSKVTKRFVQNDQIINSNTESNYTDKNPSISPPKRGEESHLNIKEFLKEWENKIHPLSEDINQSRRLRKYSRAITRLFDGDISKWTKYLETIQSSDFLMGRVKDFRISLEWALKSNNMVKVMSGQYSPRTENTSIENNKMLSSNLMKESNNAVINKHESILRSILKHIRAKIGESCFYSWFNGVELIEQENKIHLKTVSRVKKDLIHTNCDRHFREVLALLKLNRKVCYV